MRKGKFLVVGLAFLLGIGAAYGAGMTDVKSRVLPAVYKSKTGLTQKVEISVKHEGNPTSVTIRLGEQSQKARLQPGDNTFYVEVPAVESTQALPLTLTAGKEQQQATVQVAPVRHWQVNFVQHTHTDIGYTRSQMEILQEQLRYIDYALDYCDLTDDYPEAAQFRWTCETAWAVSEYLKCRPATQIERLKKRVKEGRIELATDRKSVV